MKHLRTFNESSFDDYVKSEEFYKNLVDRLYIDIDEHFKDKGRFFPLKIQLNKRKSGEYFGSVCMALGWTNRINDEEEDWLFDKVRVYKEKWGIHFSICGDSSGGGDLIYDIQNDDFPKHSTDYFNFPPDPFPDRLD